MIGPTPCDPDAADAAPRDKSLIERLLLQLGHRVASVGLFLFIVAGVTMYVERLGMVWQLPGLAFACADVGVLCAAGAYAIGSWRRSPRGESVGLFLFSLLLALLSGWMMLMYRRGWWQS